MTVDRGNPLPISWVHLRYILAGRCSRENFCNIYTVRSTADHWVETVGSLMSITASDCGFSGRILLSARRCMATIPTLSHLSGDVMFFLATVCSSHISINNGLNSVISVSFKHDTTRPHHIIASAVYTSLPHPIRYLSFRLIQTLLRPPPHLLHNRPTR